MIKVMFICLGNICRSPMAQFVMHDMIRREGLGDLISVNSAATSHEEEGNPPYYATQEKLREKGVPVLAHRATYLTRADAAEYDYLVCMDEWNVRRAGKIVGEAFADKLSLLLSFTGEDRAIADPWYTRDFETTYQDVVRGCRALLDTIKEGL